MLAQMIRKRRFRRNALTSVVVTLLTVALLAALFICLLPLPRWLVDMTATGGLSPQERLSDENAVRAVLIQAFAGLFFIVTALFTWRQIRIARKAN